jgi:hypothetical protein
VLAEHAALVGAVLADVGVDLIRRALPVGGPVMVAAQPGQPGPMPYMICRPASCSARSVMK